MQTIRLLEQTLAYLCGFGDVPPTFLRWLPIRSLWWSLWWSGLLLLIILFCGQSSKFIYIDF